MTESEPMDAGWPLVGRDSVLARCGELLGSPACHGIVLIGGPGHGKTSLLYECAHRAEVAGFAVLHAAGRRSTSAIPFGALASLLPSGERMVEAGVPALRQAADAFALAAGPRPLILAIDDAHLLDAPSAVLIRQLVATRGLFAMLTVGATASVTAPITALLGDPLVALVDVAPVEGVDSPIQHLPSSLDEAQRHSMELIAFGEPLGLVAAQGLGAVGVDRLESSGWLRRTHSGRRTVLTLVHPADGDALRAELALVRSRALRRDLAAGIARFGARRRGDVVKMATLLNDADRTGPPDLFAAAARQALFADDLTLAEKLLEAAEIAEPRFETQHLLGDVHARLRRRVDDTDIGSVAATEAQRSLQAMGDAATAFWQDGHRDAADQILATELASMPASAWRDEMVALRATLDACAGLPVLALRRLDTINDTIDVTDGRPYVAAALGASLALTQLGRAREALDLIEPAREAHLALDDRVTIFPLELLSANESAALAELGRLGEASSVAMGGYRRGEQSHSIAGQAYNAFALGRSYLARGMVTSALRWSRESVVLFAAAAEQGPLRWAMGDVALAAAMSGDAASARQTLRRLEMQPHPAQAMESGIGRARAWVAVAEGDVASGRDTLAREAGWCRERGIVDGEAVLLHDLARLDGADQAADRLSRVTADAQGKWLPALAADAAAIAGCRADELAASADTLSALGANLIAAEAAMRACAAYAAEGRQRESAAWRRRAGDLVALCERALTPVVAYGDGPSHLTNREREVALLAAAGMSSRAIAERLYLSARAIENSLARVFTKLGIADRTGIARALRLE